MKKHIAVILCTIACVTTYAGNDSFPSISEIDRKGFFPLSSQKHSTIYVDNGDFKVVEIAAGMLAEDIERVTGRAAETSVIENHRMIAADACIVAGTWGQSRLVDWIVKKNNIDVNSIEGKWEAFIITTTVHPKNGTPLLAIIGSDRRGTAYGLTSLSEAIGVSPWYWWADVTPAVKKGLFIEPGTFVQDGPSVQYRGIFITPSQHSCWMYWHTDH